MTEKEGRLSLDDLDPEEALRALLAVDPEAPAVDDDQGEAEAEAPTE